MKTIIIPASVSPFQVEGFPEECERTPDRKGRMGGAIHIRPASTLECTEGEWEHIAKMHPELVAKATVIGDRKSKTWEQRMRERGKDPLPPEPVRAGLVELPAEVAPSAAPIGEAVPEALPPPAQPSTSDVEREHTEPPRGRRSGPSSRS